MVPRLIRQDEKVPLDIFKASSWGANTLLIFKASSWGANSWCPLKVLCTREGAWPLSLFFHAKAKEEVGPSLFLMPSLRDGAPWSFQRGACTISSFQLILATKEKIREKMRRLICQLIDLIQSFWVHK